MDHSWEEQNFKNAIHGQRDVTKYKKMKLCWNATPFRLYDRKVGNYKAKIVAKKRQVAMGIKVAKKNGRDTKWKLKLFAIKTRIFSTPKKRLWREKCTPSFDSF